jgi:hypothetical protein
MGYYLCAFFRSPASVCRYSVYNVHAATPLWLVLLLFAKHLFMFLNRFAITYKYSNPIFRAAEPGARVPTLHKH